jgi:hypothetical protein
MNYILQEKIHHLYLIKIHTPIQVLYFYELYSKLFYSNNLNLLYLSNKNHFTLSKDNIPIFFQVFLNYVFLKPLLKISKVYLYKPKSLFNPKKPIFRKSKNKVFLLGLYFKNLYFYTSKSQVKILNFFY